MVERDCEYGYSSQCGEVSNILEYIISEDIFFIIVVYENSLYIRNIIDNLFLDVYFKGKN